MNNLIIQALREVKKRQFNKILRNLTETLYKNSQGQVVLEIHEPQLETANLTDDSNYLLDFIKAVNLIASIYRERMELIIFLKEPEKYKHLEQQPKSIN